MFFDTHAHLADSNLYSQLDEIIKNAELNGVEFILSSGADIRSSRLNVEIADRFERVYASVGIHPHDAEFYNEEMEAELANLAKNKKVIAIGEIGLDYHYLSEDVSGKSEADLKQTQKDVFIKQIKLANKLCLPIVVHMRDATEDTLKILREYDLVIKKPSIMHCYAGSDQTLKEILALGYVISLGGVITFKNAKKEDVIRLAGLDNILLETDCPYLAPMPHRGEVNRPEYIPLIADKISDVLEVSAEEVARRTTANAKKVFGI